jgi:Na+/H+ antiporter NhaD/arsenite permease-like protein
MAGGGDAVKVMILAWAGEHGAPDVEPWVTFLFAGFLVAMILCLALEEKLHAKKSVIVGLFAVICLLVGGVCELLPLGAVTLGGHEIHLPIYVTGIDWQVIAIILGSSLFVDVTSRSGLFTWIAIKVTKFSRGDPRKLLIYYGLMTVVFSAVLNNVTAMIIVGSLTGVSLKKLGRGDKLLGFLLVEGLLTNIGGLLTLVSSVPNIIVGNAAGIEFVDFFVAASPYVVVATAVTLFMGAKIFGIPKLTTPEERAKAAELVASFDENDGIESRFFFWFGGVMTALFILAIATTAYMPYVQDLGMGFVALAFAVIMLIRYKSVADKFYQALDWDLLGFFAGLFVVINVMEHAQVLTLIGDGLSFVFELSDSVGSGTLLVISAFFSSVTDNIPLAAMLAKILGSPELVTPTESPLWWAVVFGANLGGNLTPIGSASTLVAVTIIHKYEIKLSFLGFVKKALPFAVVQILIAVIYVVARHEIFGG